MEQKRLSSSLLELEAAKYFELDLAQLNLCPIEDGNVSDISRKASNVASFRKTQPVPFRGHVNHQHCQGYYRQSQQQHQQRHHHHCHQFRHHSHHHHHHHQKQDTINMKKNGRVNYKDMGDRSIAKKGARQSDIVKNRLPGQQQHQSQTHFCQRQRQNVYIVRDHQSDLDKVKAWNCNSEDLRQREESRQSCSECANQQRGQAGNNKATATPESPRIKLAPKSPTRHSSNHDLELAVVVNSSSTTSTNSLPSVSSSPSVSPSIVCPHLSLDDLLECRQSPNISPHTIGLCSKCRLDPPPNVHSPLSPLFRPCSYRKNEVEPGAKMNQSTGNLSTSSSTFTATRLPQQAKTPMRRGYSDHQAGFYSNGKRKSAAMGHESGGNTATACRSTDDLDRFRDDSLDYGLGPDELKRLQMSPTLRNSVEFIRNNSIESGRVVKIYKNGEPFDKPLRVCILRGEFSNLDHFLDHINSRLLVPLGARYLFHLDGQLVYSVHELKHGSTYIVSGVRTFDFRANDQLKEHQQQQHKRNAAQQQGKMVKNAAQDAPVDQRPGMQHNNTKTVSEISASNIWQRSASSGQSRQGPKSKHDTSQIPVSSQETSRKSKTNAPTQSMIVGRNSSGGVGGKTIDRRNSRFKVHETNGEALRSCDSLHNQDNSRAEKPAKLTRAKSEMSALPKKQKKNVTFMDTGRGSSPTLGDHRVTINDEDDEVAVLDAEYEYDHGANVDVDIELDSDKEAEARDEPVPSSKNRPRKGSDTMNSRKRTDDAAIQVSSSSSASLLPATVSSRFRELRTSDVGIQVSDSIEGYLIDLPVALPAKGDDSNVATTKTPRPRFDRYRSTRGPDKPRGKFGPDRAGEAKSRKRFVTITERQLSQDEMNEFKDLSQGDHHHEAFVEELSLSGSLSGAEPDGTTVVRRESLVVPDRTNTIAIGSDPQNDMGTQTTTGPPPSGRAESSGPDDTSRLVTSSQEGRGGGGGGGGDEFWQYPGGQAASATPTERPVSQSGPSESVRARVTTPTPSLSTVGGDSLSMSYETIDGQPDVKPRGTGATSAPATLAPKRRVEVVGKLCSGLYAPTRNFRLVWVNGFVINDIYPENSVSEQQLFESAANTSSSETDPRSGSPSAHLAPDHSRRRPGGTGEQRAPVVFKPSERYHNWVCHSRRHNELIYPVGSLVVLWCRWTNEQRYYSKHTSNVSSIALATLDLDLIASAQISNLVERPPIGASIHLWSLTSLDTIAIIEDDQLKAKLIFSLRLKSTKSNGCELSVGARDDKQVFVFTFSRRLTQSATADPEANESAAGKAEKKVAAESSAPRVAPKRRFSLDQSAPVTMRASKLLQASQVPLFIMKVPNCATEFKPNASGLQLSPETKFEPVICFGRRCFQVWSPDARQQKLRLLQPDGKSASKFTSLLAKATCLCRLAPSELLIGDSDGNVALLLMSLSTGSRGGGGSEQTGGKRPVPATKLSLGQEGPNTQKYVVEAFGLLGPEATAPSDRSLKLDTATSNQSGSITCLTRITGSLFMSADSSCAVRFWRIRRQSGDKSAPSGAATSVPVVKLEGGMSAPEAFHCDQLTCISLPPDLGFICTIVLCKYNRVDSVVEFYIVSTCNTILFGTVKLCQSNDERGHLSARSDLQQDLLANSSLSVVYEGHETSASSLVADISPTSPAKTANEVAANDLFYFTCSLDCRICKWNGKQLIWKSMLPSPCASLAVHPTGSVMAVGSIDGTVYILDKISGLLISYFPLTPVRINCLAYSSDGSLLAAGCANGSIFILPVHERGMKYKKVSIFQSPHAVVSLQFSLDNRYMLTSVTHGSYQELILWDLPNFRYMRDNVKLVADKIKWFDSICSGSEDVRAIWENANMIDELPMAGGGQRVTGSKNSAMSVAAPGRRLEARRDGFVVNLSCHRLITTDVGSENDEPSERNFVIASDTRGYLRLFRYPCYDIQQAFYAVRISSSSVNCCRFLRSQPISNSDDDNNNYFVSASLDGSICLWSLE